MLFSLITVSITSSTIDNFTEQISIVHVQQSVLYYTDLQRVLHLFACLLNCLVRPKQARL